MRPGTAAAGMGAAGPAPRPARSPRQLFWREFRKSPTALAGAALLAALYLAALAADFLAPYSVERQNLELSYAPPTAVHWGAGGPYVRAQRLTDPVRNLYAADPARRYPVRFVVPGHAYRVCGLLPTDRHLFGVAAPGEIHLLGTDQFGRDVLARALFGARISLSVGLIGIAITFALGIFVGGLSGYFGGLTDEIAMRLSELVLSIPGFYLIVALAGVLPATLPSDQRYLLIVFILSLLGWAGLARVVRGMVLALRENEYVTAARALGAGPLRVLFRHIVPNTLSFLIVAATISVPGYILGEVFLSFLGVGVQEPVASWGNMLTAAQSVRVLTSYPWVLTPGFLIFVTVMAFNFLGDGLSDALNPRASRAGRSA
jgi:peptide/nickel transport system permease protein